MMKDKIKRGNTGWELFVLWWLFLLRWVVPGLVFMGVWLQSCRTGYSLGNAWFLYLGWMPALLLGWIASLCGRRILMRRLEHIRRMEADED